MPKSLKVFVNRATGFPSTQVTARKTYSGLAPLTWHTVSVWARQEDVGVGDVWTKLIANGQEAPQRVTVADTWTLLSVSVLSTAAGEIKVVLMRDVPQIGVTHLVELYWDDLQIQVGRDCDPSTGCSLVGSDALAYADIAAMEAAGWDVDDLFTSGTHGWSMDSGFAHAPQTTSLKGTISFAGGGPMTAQRVFSGLTPSTPHTVKVWAYTNQRHWHDVGMGIMVLGPDEGDAIQQVGAWEQLVVHGMTNGSGELTVLLQRTALLQNYEGLNFWFSGLQIYEGGSC
jgi:hypothetical protein